MLSTLTDFADQATQLISANPQWVAPAVFALCLVESLPFLALLVPGTAILLSVGALVGAGEMELLPVWLAVSLGAGLGSWISFWLGQRYGGNLFHFEWARKRLHLYAKAQAFFPLGLVQHRGLPLHRPAARHRAPDRRHLRHVAAGLSCLGLGLGLPVGQRAAAAGLAQLPVFLTSP